MAAVASKGSSKTNPTKKAKTGGRKPGTPNQKTVVVMETLQRLGCDPIEGMALIAMGRVPCRVCDQKKYISQERLFAFQAAGVIGDLPEPEQGAKRSSGRIMCPVCYGTSFEITPTKLRGDMFKELAQYVAPKRKAIEIADPDGNNPFDGFVEMLKRAAIEDAD